jgi:hypothetical protein
MYKTLKTPLTPSLLKFFLNEGYQYCLSKRSFKGKNVSAILLTPVKERPDLRQLQNFEAIFVTSEEPLEMVRATDGPPVLLELEPECLGSFVDFLCKSQSPLRIV